MLLLVAGAMLALYVLSFLLCSDEQCLSGNCDGDCEALICLWVHGNTCAVNGSLGSSHEDCHCVCHVPTTPVLAPSAVTLSDVGSCVPGGSSDYSSFALIGGVFALTISGLYLSVPASVGFVVLFGIAVLNGIVLVSHFQHLRESGLEVNEAVRQGAMDRLRPVLMTALIAVFSLVPMLFAAGPGSEIQKPLATVVAGGLLTSTSLTLFLIPMIYRVVENATTRREGPR